MQHARPQRTQSQPIQQREQTSQPERPLVSRGHEPSAPIVLAAPYLEFLSADALTDAGVSDVVHRPINAAALLSSLNGRLPRRARADTAIQRKADEAT